MAKPERGTFIFGVLMFITQIIIAALNGVFIRPVNQNLPLVSLTP